MVESRGKEDRISRKRLKNPLSEKQKERRTIAALLSYGVISADKIPEQNFILHYRFFPKISF